MEIWNHHETPYPGQSLSSTVIWLMARRTAVGVALQIALPRFCSWITVRLASPPATRGGFMEIWNHHGTPYPKQWLRSTVNWLVARRTAVGAMPQIRLDFREPKGRRQDLAKTSKIHY